MDRDTALRILKDHEPELRERAVEHISLFGSVASDEADIDSDVDVLIDYEPDSGFSLLDLAHVQLLLEDLFRCRVDVVTRRGLKAPMREAVLSEAVRAF